MKRILVDENRMTVREALRHIADIMGQNGGKSFELGDFHASVRGQIPNYNPPKIMLDDGSEGWYVAVGLKPQDLADNDSMAFFADQIGGYINLDVDCNLERKSSPSSLSTDDILDLPIRGDGSEFIIARVGLTFLKKGQLVANCSVPVRQIDVPMWKATPANSIDMK